MKLENTIYIGASPSIVWKATEDVERWPQWTASVETVRRLDNGQFDVGSKVRIKQPGLPETEWRVTALTRGDGFTWETRIRGMRVIASHELTPSGAGTQNVLRIEMLGVVAVLMWPLVRPPLRKSLEQENAGLKTICEA